MNEEPEGPMLKIAISTPVDRDAIEIRVVKYAKIGDQWGGELLLSSGEWSGYDPYAHLDATFVISGRDLVRWDGNRQLRGQFLSDETDVPNPHDVGTWLATAIKGAGVTAVEFLMP